MFGAILGDIIGSAYEFDFQNYKAKDFPLFCQRSTFTDDTVMTLAVADALMKVTPKDDDETIKRELVQSMQTIGRRYPHCGYGAHFAGWLYDDNPEPYNSCGNGSGMRVSPAGWFYNDLDTVLHMAKLTAEISHNHPEGIKGAQAIAGSIVLARAGRDKNEIKRYVENYFHYDLSRTCDEIRPTYHHVETCQGSVPEAITAFLEGTDFEDVIRTAVSLGGDSDTIADMAGAIAEANYGIPEELKAECWARLPDDLADILRRANLHMARLDSVPTSINSHCPLAETMLLEEKESKR